MTSEAQHFPGILRPATSEDADNLRALFIAAVSQLTCAHYTPAQRRVWQAAADDVDDWRHRMRQLRPFVVELAGSVAGYADLQPDGLIDHFYVSPRFARQGVGKMLMGEILRRAQEANISLLYAYVSLTAQPFFRMAGFSFLSANIVCRDGVFLNNGLMEKQMRYGA